LVVVVLVVLWQSFSSGVVVRCFLVVVVDVVCLGQSLVVDVVVCLGQSSVVVVVVESFLVGLAHLDALPEALAFLLFIVTIVVVIVAVVIVRVVVLPVVPVAVLLLVAILLVAAVLPCPDERMKGERVGMEQPWVECWWHLRDTHYRHGRERGRKGPDRPR
jgi:hypothetical protein